MSLDVYLTLDGLVAPEPERVWVREDGRTISITAEEYRQRYGREPLVSPSTDTDTVYEGNITHNLNHMAEEAGIYRHLWRPDEIGVTHARQLVEPLRAGLAMLRADPSRFEALNPANGWGSFDGLVRFVAEYLEACERHPDARVEVSR